MFNRPWLSALGGVLAATLFVSLGAAQDPEAERFWPQWRGPSSTGVSSQATPPLEWSESRNVRWKIEIPGRGSSSPVVWGDRLFVLTAIPASAAGAATHTPRGGISPRETHRFVVYAVDRTTGKVAWERIAREAQPHEATHPDNGTCVVWDHQGTSFIVTLDKRTGAEVWDQRHEPCAQLRSRNR